VNPAIDESLPATGPVAEFAARGEVLVSPSRIGRPWVVAAGDRVIKAYDLNHFHGSYRDRLQIEAATAMTAAEVSGVVRTYRAETVGTWLVIEMERLGETVAGHLEAVQAQSAEARTQQEWGRLLEGVAWTLGELHRRRLVHRDVKPANLMFDRDGRRLVVADFSISVERPRHRPRWRENKLHAPADVSGTDRYVAPEVFVGRIGPSADQYALAVVALDIFGENLPPAAASVLHRATAHDPAARFPTVSDFGVVLRASVDPASPHTGSSRLARVAPPWRHAWGPGACAAASTYGALFWLHPPRLNAGTGLLLPTMVGAGTMVAARMAAAMYGNRTQPRLAIARRPWFPLFVFAVAALVMSPLLIAEPDKRTTYTVEIGIFAITSWAILGATPPDAGEWLIGLVRRWERWRARHVRGRAARWGVRFTVGTGLVLVAATPAAVNPYASTRGSPSSHDARLMVVARARRAMLASNITALCATARIPVARPAPQPCAAWGPVAASWVREDVLRRHGPRFAPADLADTWVTYNDGSEQHGAPVWSLHEGSTHGPYIGTLEREDDRGRVWQVTITRNPPSADPLAGEESQWTYEIARSSHGWHVTAVEICDVSSRRPCLTLSQLGGRRLAAARRAGPPAGAQALSTK
jgi:tRNA A-37 threonylcarbamoyl transferase component Bud32